MGLGPSKLKRRSSPPQPVYGPKEVFYKPYNVPDQNANPHLSGGGNVYSYYQPGYRWDPAAGCNKNFIGTYKCGNNPPKTVSEADATGKVIYFDCTSEHNRCSNFMLELTTEGKVRFTDGNNNLITAGLVSPNPFASSNAAPRTNESVNTDQLLEDIDKLNTMVLDGELSGLSRAFVQYMYPSQQLKRGEYLCSRTGNCILVLDKTGNLEVRALKLKTAKIGEIMQGNRDSTSCALHELRGLNVDNLGKVANISVDGKRRMYSNGQIALGAKYVEITGIDELTGQSVTYDNPEDTLESISNDTGAIDYCFEQCTSRPDCGGFVVSQSDPGTCHLKNTDIFPVGDRVQSNSTQLYKRLYAPKPVSESCAKPGNTNVVAIDSVLFEHYPIDKNDPRMKSSTLCGADQVVETPSSMFETAAGELTKMYDAVMESISATINKQTQYNALRNDPAMDVSGKIAKYKKNSDEITEYAEKQETIQGTEEDTRIELISETYKYVLWSILAIVIIIAIVYYGDVGSYPTNISSITDIFKSSSAESENEPV